LPIRPVIAAGRLGSIALSAAVFGEMKAVLARPKFKSVLSEFEQLRILQLLTVRSIWFDPEIRISDCRDPKDNKYLELALSANASAILTGDLDLLALNPWRSIQIMNARDFLTCLESGSLMPP